MYTKVRDYNYLLEKMRELEGAEYIAVLWDIDYLHQKSLKEKMADIYQFFVEKIPLDVLYLGRDEFALLSTKMTLEELFALFIRLKEQFKLKFGTSFTAGFGRFPSHGEDSEDILRYLEEAVYEGKQQGRDRLNLYHERKMKKKINYYTLGQLERLSKISGQLKRSEASLLREAMDEIIRKYED